MTIKRLIAGTAIAAVAATSVAAQTVSIGTNPQGSMAYIAGAGVAKVAIEDGDVKMRVVPQGGPVVTLPLLNNGELDFTIAVSVVTAFARSGDAMFKGASRKTSMWQRRCSRLLSRGTRGRIPTSKVSPTSRANEFRPAIPNRKFRVCSATPCSQRRD